MEDGFLAVDPWLWIPGCELLAVDSWQWIPGCGLLAVDSWLWNPGCGLLVLESLGGPLGQLAGAGRPGGPRGGLGRKSYQIHCKTHTK